MNRFQARPVPSIVSNSFDVNHSFVHSVSRLLPQDDRSFTSKSARTTSATPSSTAPKKDAHSVAHRELWENTSLLSAAVCVRMCVVMLPRRPTSRHFAKDRAEPCRKMDGNGIALKRLAVEGNEFHGGMRHLREGNTDKHLRKEELDMELHETQRRFLRVRFCGVRGQISLSFSVQRRNGG